MAHPNINPRSGNAAACLHTGTGTRQRQPPFSGELAVDNAKSRSYGSREKRPSYGVFRVLTLRIDPDKRTIGLTNPRRFFQLEAVGMQRHSNRGLLLPTTWSAHNIPLCNPQNFVNMRLSVHWPAAALQHQ